MKVNLQQALVVCSLVVGTQIVGCEAESTQGAGSLTTYAVLEGFVDPDAGVVRLKTFVPDDAGNFIEQPLSVITEDKNGVRGTATAVNSFEFAVECNGSSGCVAPSTPPGAVALGCGNVNSFDLDVSIRSFFPQGLAAAHVEFTDVTNNVSASRDNSICNSDPVPLNLQVGGTSLDASRGLFRYGNLVPNATAPTGAPSGAADTVRWRFRNPGGAFRFTARVLARPCGTGAECTVGRQKTEFWEAQGTTATSTVAAFAEGAGAVFLTGDFTYLGPHTGAGAMLAAAGTAQPGAAGAFPVTDQGDVRSVIPDGVGGAYMAGTFGIVDGQVRRIVHVDAAGNLDSGFVAPLPVGTLNALALADGKLFVGGSFSLASPARANAMALNAVTGQVDTAWAPTVNGAVNALVASESVVFAGGSFTVFGVAASRLAAVSSLDATNVWSQPTVNGAVNTLTVGNGLVYFGGAFTTVNGLARRFAAAVQTGGALTIWNPSPNKQVNAIAANGVASVWIGGGFTSIGGANRARIASLDAVTGAALSPNPGSDGLVAALSVDGGVVYVGGQFSILGGSNLRRRVGALDAATGALAAWSPGVGPKATTNLTKNSVLSVAASGATVFVGGSFDSIGGVYRAGAAAIDLASGQATDWNPGVTGRGRAMAFAGDRVYIGGTFTAVGGVPFTGLAAVSVSDGTPIVGFSPVLNGGGPLAEVHALAMVGSTVVAGGSFVSANGTARQGLVALTDTGVAVAGWAPTISAGGVVRALAVHGDVIAVGGDFTLTGSQNLSFVSSPVSAFSVTRAFAVDGSVRCVAAGRDFLVVGGSFANVDGAPRSRLAALSRSGAVLPFVSGANADVIGCTVAGNNIHAAGAFTLLGGLGAKRFASATVRGVGSLNTGGRLDGNADSVIVVGDVAMVGGSFVSSFVSDDVQRRSGLAAVAAD